MLLYVLYQNMAGARRQLLKVFMDLYLSKYMYIQSESINLDVVF